MSFHHAAGYVSIARFPRGPFLSMTDQSMIEAASRSRGHRPDFRLALLHPRHWPRWALFGAIGLVAALPRRIRCWVGDRLAGIFVRFGSKRKRRILTNLALCYPGLSTAEREKLMFRHVRVAAHIILGHGRLMFAPRATLRDDCDVFGIEHVEAAIADGRNVILLTPHFLAMERAGLRLNLDYPIMTMIRAHEDPVSDWIVSRMRTRLGAILFRHDASLIAMVRAIRRGHWFYYLPDEDQGRAGAVFADFFGVPKASVPVLERLARMADAAVVPMRSAYDPDTRRYGIYFDEPLPGRDATGAVEDARHTNAVMERLIDADPAQYLWTQKIFRTRPTGMPPVY
jgi:Kdo2-lipid IVA lauroyltransferase/acyltransferase